ncbi:MAG: PQQ-dependent sugar dehydrogenase, partial [Bacteroidota bacterium]
MSTILRVLPALIVSVALVSCQQPSSNLDTLPPGDPDNGELLLPGGFEALVVIEEVGRSRHLVVNDNGDIYVKLRFNPNMNRRGGNVGIRDTDGDGKADIVSYFGDYEDEGGLACCITINDDYLYFSSTRSVYRQKLTPGSLVPESEIETILTDDHEHGVTHWHNTKPMAFDGEGNMFVPFGTPSDACQDMDEYGPVGIPGGAGLDPCPELEKHGGIWKFDADRQGQTQDDGTLFATGIRSVLGLKWNDDYDHLFAVVHGIDNFHTMFPEDFTAWDGAMLPAETFIRMSGGEDFGWPYAYYDQMKEQNVLQPGYGGDGEIVGRASEFDEPIMGFPGHFAPQDLLFYEGDQFPDRYKEGAFVVFHGSSDRPPYPQAGFHVAFIPFEDGLPTGEWEVFADGFAQVDTVVNSSDARYRPM